MQELPVVVQKSHETERNPPRNYCSWTGIRVAVQESNGTAATAAGQESNVAVLESNGTVQKLTVANQESTVAVQESNGNSTGK